ncbi:zinc-binding dehydrogenase [Sphaerisporangium corydalis]|uniref:Zinc-binding dehydrogenase n=1 Tax=Sphaerisporangium corydalis TaxID=1441875 RepID=A0ABV9EKJ3_9ACTN
MKALVADAQGAAGVRVGEVPEPVPERDEVLVEVLHASVNFGEMRYAAYRPPGTVMGHDAAGVVLRAAADGTGPPAGSRVVAFGPGAWAQQAVFGTGSVAEVPEQVDLAEAAALPMTGITALRTLRAAGPILGRRVLITGASGGVGRIAVQLARLGGAHVIASVGSPARGAGLAELGADEVVVGLDTIGRPVDVVLENVGGPHLVAAWGLLGPGGNLQSIGWASGEPAVFPPNSTFGLGPARTLSSFGDVTDTGPDLATLVGLLARGELSAEVGWRGAWDLVAEAADALFARRIPGKAVLDIPPLRDA